MVANTLTQLDNVNGLVQEFWSPMFEKELRESTLWLGLTNDPRYSLERIKGGDTFRVSKINKPTSTIRSFGTDADSFDTNTLSTTQVNLVVNRRCTSAFEFDDLTDLFSQIEQDNSEIRLALLADVREQANDHIKSLISPSTSSPDHTVSSVTDYNATQLSIVRGLAAVAKWRSTGEPWFNLLSPSFYTDLMDATTLSASDTMGDGISPMVSGSFESRKRMGFNIIEDDSLSADTGFAFIPSFLKSIAGPPRFKVSDQHSNKRFAYIISVDFPLGAVQMDNTRVISIA